MNKFILRVITFTIGLFIMAFGVALSVKANLGISPISCVPYVYSCKFPLTLGQVTIVFNLVLIMLQMALLRRDYRLILGQLPFVFILGLFIDLSMYALSNLYLPNYASQVLLCLISCIAIGFGVFLEITAKVIYLPGEGLAMAISNTFKKEFGKVKIGVDVSMVTVGILSSFLFLHQLQGIREGTIVAAIFVGCIVKVFNNTLSSAIENMKLI